MTYLPIGSLHYRNPYQLKDFHSGNFSLGQLAVVLLVSIVGFLRFHTGFYLEGNLGNRSSWTWHYFLGYPRFSDAPVWSRYVHVPNKQLVDDLVGGKHLPISSGCCLYFLLRAATRNAALSGFAARHLCSETFFFAILLEKRPRFLSQASPDFYHI